MTFFKVCAVIIAAYIFLWAAKKIFLTFALNFLNKKRYCTICLENGIINKDSTWKLLTHIEDVPIFMCNACKKHKIPDDISDYVEQAGIISRKEKI